MAAQANGLRGTEFYFDTISVTGTENLMMAATLAEGVTVLENAAREPEVKDLADLLNKMGAHIEGAGTHEIRIHGVARLHGASHTIIPDRIETGTFLTAAAITGGDLVLERCNPENLAAVLAKLEEVGVHTIHHEGSSGLHTLSVKPGNKLRALDVTTQEYPGFPTDMQAQYMTLMTQAEGSSVVTETIFENRFMHALELARMGADITVNGRRALVRGKTLLSGAKIQASDLRASASLGAGRSSRGRRNPHRPRLSHRSWL